MTGADACSSSEDLLRAQAGEPRAFAALIRTHQRLVYSLALRMLATSGAAEDLAQEVFIQLHRNLHVIESDAHLVFWLRRVATNLAIDRLRQDRKHESLPLDEEAPFEDEHAAADPLLQRKLQVLLAQLPPQARAVVLLRFQEDMDPLEIAAALALSPNTVKSHLRRSLLRLRAGFTVGAPELVSNSELE